MGLGRDVIWWYRSIGVMECYWKIVMMIYLFFKIFVLQKVEVLRRWVGVDNYFIYSVYIKFIVFGGMEEINFVCFWDIGGKYF